MAVTKRKGGRRAPSKAQLARAADEGRESLDFYLQEISRIPLLKIDQETALARRAFKGDVEAQEKLARHNVRFVVSVAKKFQNRGVPLMDLIGEGNVGLMTAARKFDPDRGVKFISYAVWWIRQAIQAAIARHGRPVRVPLNRTADLNRLGRATVLLTERLGRAPTTAELVEATGLTRDAVRALGALHIEALRLDHPVREADDRGRWSGSSRSPRRAPTPPRWPTVGRPTWRPRWPPCLRGMPRCSGSISGSTTERVGLWKKSGA